MRCVACRAGRVAQKEIESRQTYLVCAIKRAGDRRKKIYVCDDEALIKRRNLSAMESYSTYKAKVEEQIGKPLLPSPSIARTRHSCCRLVRNGWQRAEKAQNYARCERKHCARNPFREATCQRIRPSQSGAFMFPCSRIGSNPSCNPHPSTPVPSCQGGAGLRVV